MAENTQADVVVIKVSRRCWYAIKRLQAYAPARLAPKKFTSKTRSFRAVLDAIGDGDKELLRRWQGEMKGLREL